MQRDLPAENGREGESGDKMEERRGSAEGKQAAPAFLHVKPQSGSGLMLPQRGGGMLEVMLSNKSTSATVEEK